MNSHAEYNHAISTMRSLTIFVSREVVRDCRVIFIFVFLRKGVVCVCTTTNLKIYILNITISGHLGESKPVSTCMEEYTSTHSSGRW
jgi:hypothetical protein